MIKRCFYKRRRGGDCSDSSSSNTDSESDSDSIAQIEEEELEEEEEELEENQVNNDDEITVERARSEIKKNKEKKRNKRNKRSPSPGSGYEREDSSANEAKVDSSGEEDSTDKDGDSNDAIESNFADCILRCKSVYKCRLCPRILCLSEDSVQAHLNSKRHARSKKLLGVGRLKLMLNSDGEIEEDAETHVERHARTIALLQKPSNSSNKVRRIEYSSPEKTGAKMKSEEFCNSDK